MTLHIELDKNVPFPRKTEPPAFEEAITAAAKTAAMLAAAGLEVIPDADDRETAAALVEAYAADPVTTAKAVTPKQLATLTPAALLLTQQVLRDFGHRVVEDSVQIRNLVTNKLLQETENPDPRVRLKALELLGKFSDVGLFAERQEITVTHQTADDIKARLRQKLQKMIDVTPVDAELLEEGEDG
jgi:hypothetical protein